MLQALTPTAVPLLVLFAYIALVVALFKAMEKVEASAPMTEGRREDRRAESAGIAAVCGFMLIAMVCAVVL